MLSGPWQEFLFFSNCHSPPLKRVLPPPQPKSKKQPSKSKAKLAQFLIFLVLILLSERSMGQVEMVEDGMSILETFIKECYHLLQYSLMKLEQWQSTALLVLS
ncbi:putative aspartyl aminopeptidase [Iris pallida]|uniref:Aspartyl aminopeptidase n=1 Tax=Iris pallida TaxID=29817 RepID=A0AAX6FSL5_IRIPA|nr:putative aspartyl aminopeptidase [Iris pallida]